MPIKHHVTLKVAIWRSGRLLLLRERDGEGKDWLDLPGGRLEKDELLMDGLRRELREELGVEAVSIGSLPLHVWNGISPAGYPVVGLLYAVEPEHHDFDHSGAEEIVEAQWCDEKDLEGELDHVHMPVIRAVLRGRLGE